MGRRWTEIRRRHQGWLKVKFAVTFLIKGVKDDVDILNDMALALDPGGEEDNIFEPLIKDDMMFTIQASWPMKAKSLRSNSPLSPLVRRFPEFNTADMSVVMVQWSFPTSRGVAGNVDGLLKMASDYLTSRETESNYLINGWLLRFKEATDL